MPTAYRVTGATEPLVIADGVGRLEVVVDLAPAPAQSPQPSPGLVKGRSLDAPAVAAVGGSTHLPATGGAGPVWLVALLLVAAGAASALQRRASTP